MIGPTKVFVLLRYSPPINITSVGVWPLKILNTAREFVTTLILRPHNCSANNWIVVPGPKNIVSPSWIRLAALCAILVFSFICTEDFSKWERSWSY